MAISPELLAILACPVPECHGPLEEREGKLVCRRCGLRYPIEEGRPVLLPEEAERPGGSEPPAESERRLS